MTLQDKFNEDLLGGEYIDECTRFNGYYERELKDGSYEIIFDNGNVYQFKDKTIVSYIDSQDKQFIHLQIKRFIQMYIKGHPGFVEYGFQDKISCNENVINVNSLITLHIDRDQETISISNILIPDSLRFKGYGKEIINEIYKIASKHKYRVLLVQMVDSFYNRMVKRGAKIILTYDVIEITEDTKLIDDKFGDLKRKQQKNGKMNI